MRISLICSQSANFALIDIYTLLRRTRGIASACDGVPARIMLDLAIDCSIDASRNGLVSLIYQTFVIVVAVIGKRHDRGLPVMVGKDYLQRHELNGYDSASGWPVSPSCCLFSMVSSQPLGWMSEIPPVKKRLSLCAATPVAKAHKHITTMVSSDKINFFIVIIVLVFFYSNCACRYKMIGKGITIRWQKTIAVWLL